MRRLGLVPIIVLAVFLGTANPVLASPVSAGEHAQHAGGGELAADPAVDLGPGPSESPGLNPAFEEPRRGTGSGEAPASPSTPGPADQQQHPTDGPDQRYWDVEPDEDRSAETQAPTSSSDAGLNRQGSPSRQPGEGWSDPGQVQGSASEVTDPDCTGNSQEDPQARSIGECGDAGVAADGPGGPAELDEDRSLDNGCGNDPDSEGDDTGRCLGVLHPDDMPLSDPPSPQGPTGKEQDVAPLREAAVEYPFTPPEIPEAPTPPAPPPEPPAPELPVEVVSPGAPASGPAAPTGPTPLPPASPAPPLTPALAQPGAPQSMPVTGADSVDLTALGLVLVSTGTILLRWPRRG
jgi:hypothetical protein